MGATHEPLVWCKCQDGEGTVMTTKDKCLCPPCNGTIIGSVVLAVDMSAAIDPDCKKKKKKKKKKKHK
jgi:hypothetical protein